MIWSDSVADCYWSSTYCAAEGHCSFRLKYLKIRISQRERVFASYEVVLKKTTSRNSEIHLSFHGRKISILLHRDRHRSGAKCRELIGRQLGIDRNCSSLPWLGRSC